MQRLLYASIAVATTLVSLAAQDPVVRAEGTLNHWVLKTLESYPRDGTHRYHWPRKGSWAGVTQDLHYAGKLFLKGDPKKRCHCSGITFEVFLRAYEACCKDQKQPFRIPGYATAEDLDELRKLWFGTDGNRRTLVRALTKTKLGQEVHGFEKARRGDFLQLWRHSGSGHSVVFLEWVREKKEIIGFKYWSTQGSTNGIGTRTEYFATEEEAKKDSAKRKGVIREQTYIVRASRPAEKKGATRF